VGVNKLKLLITILACLVLALPVGAAGAAAPVRLPMTGFSLYYRDAAFERIGRVRIKQGLITHVKRDVAGYTSNWDCGNIGKIAYISLNRGPVKRYQILDCSQPYHRAWHIREGRVAEINESAIRRAGCIWRSGETKGRCPATLWAVRSN
jgi:hypothetical protein